MEQIVKKASLKDSILLSIEGFLYNEGFTRCKITPSGILDIIDKIVDYYEEDASLFPEILITNNFDYFSSSIICQHLPIKEAKLSRAEFSQVLKICAPLATHNWVIYIEIKNDQMRYGLLNTEVSDSSLSLYDQTVGRLKEKIEDTTIAYVRNVGQKTIELVGLNERNYVSFTLKDFTYDNDIISKLVCSFTERILHDKNDECTIIEKHFNSLLRDCHGALIGIVDNTSDAIDLVKKEIPDGIYLTKPITLLESIKSAQAEPSAQLSISLQNELALLSGMLGQDGITILSNDGKILAYHLFIQSTNKSIDGIVGGARQRAFYAMTISKLFISCLAKSQEGKIDFWSNND